MINSLHIKIREAQSCAEKKEYKELVYSYLDAEKDFQDTHEERLTLMKNAEELENKLEEILRKNHEKICIKLKEINIIQK